MEINKNYIIVGAGIAGLYAALCLLKKQKGKNIIILDRDKEAGGLLKSWESEKYGKFDIGTHIIAETGNYIVDEILEPFYTTDKWVKMSGKTKDLPGCFYKGNYNYGSQYINIDSFNDDLKIEYLKEINSKLENLTEEIRASQNAFEEYKLKYGESFIENVIEPIYQKTFGKSTKEMAVHATNFLPLNRVISDEASNRSDFLENQKLRSVFGFPQQKNISNDFVSKTCSYYPKQRGIDILIKKIIEYLINKGVQIEMNV